jgi:hypothetical protein
MKLTFASIKRIKQPEVRVRLMIFFLCAALCACRAEHIDEVGKAAIGTDVSLEEPAKDRVLREFRTELISIETKALLNGSRCDALVDAYTDLDLLAASYNRREKDDWDSGFVLEARETAQAITKVFLELGYEIMREEEPMDCLSAEEESIRFWLRVLSLHPEVNQSHKFDLMNVVTPALNRAVKAAIKAEGNSKAN